MDDPGTVAQNPLLHPPTRATRAYYWSHPAHGLFIPVTYTVWAALAAFARVGGTKEWLLDPMVFHGANVAIHIITALVVMGILRVLLNHSWAAVGGALLFAIHPLQVEAVGWVSGTKDLLGGLLGLTALLLYLYRLSGQLRPDTEGARPGHGGILYGLATLSLALALLSKPSAMTIPAIALVLDYLLFRHSLRAGLRLLWGWFVLSGVCMAIAWIAQPAMRQMPAPLWARPLLVGDALAFYLWKVLVPINLAVCYGRTVPELINQWWFYLTWIVPTALLVILWRQRGNHPMLLAAGAIFVLAPAPMLGLFKFDYQYFSTVADHYLYVALLGPALAGGWLLARLGAAAPRIAQVLATVVLALLCMASVFQSQTWRDDPSLYTHSLWIAPRGVLALHNLGNYYELCNPPDRARAAKLYEIALDVQPNHYESMGALAATLARMNRTDDAIFWFEHFVDHEAALPAELRPEAYADHLLGFARTLMHRGEHARAAKYFERYLSLRPNDFYAARDLSVCRQRISPAAPVAEPKKNPPFSGAGPSN